MAQFSLSAATNLFKIKYGKLSDNVYNSANVMLGRVNKKYDFTGRQMFIPVPQSFQGGVGSGSLPTPNVANYEDAIITAKKVYSVVQIEREAIKASMNSEGAFVQGTKEVIQKGVESYMRNASRILFNDGTGALGTIQANATGTAAAPVIIVTAATWKEANFEEKDYVNCSTDSSVFEIVSVVAATRTVTLSRISGALDLTTGGSGLIVYMQNSKDNDPMGIKGALDASSGSLYTVPVARRWQAVQEAAGGAGISTDLMNKVMLEVQRRSGKVPNLIMTSFTQFRKILNLLEDQKQYNIDPKSADLKGKISFKGIEFMSSAGAIGIFPERFCEDDRMYFLNDNYITCYHRPDFGWFEDDGTVFLRGASSDDYSARYGGYYENYIVPVFHGVLSGLAV
jgi:hypothetical protein